LKPAQYLLYPFAFLYAVIVTLRNLFFDIGILRSRRFPIWIITVGNLSAGGTGKSPHTEYIARLMENLTRSYENLDLTFNKIGVISRGYGRANRGFLLVNNSSNAREIGDEPMQLKKRLKDIYIGVDESRVRGIRILLSLNPQLRLILLDDGFQHRYVKPTLSILLTNYNAPFYNDHMLPAGRLREPPIGYKRAKIIIVTNVPVNITDLEKKLIVKNINPTRKQKVFFSSIYYEALQPVFNSKHPVPVIDKNCTVLLLTGIANTHSLYNHLAEMAGDVIPFPFPDHHIFESTDISKVVKTFNNISNPNKVIITTEKDSVRLHLGELMRDFGTAPVFYLPIRVKVHEEKDFENEIISSLNPLSPNKPILKFENTINLE
jgi:tetraacyldisaccharide 4'-kinase